MLKNFSEVLDAVKGIAPQRVAVAVAQDDAVLEAVRSAKEQGIADFVLVGDTSRADTHESKVMSIALGALLGQK